MISKIAYSDSKITLDSAGVTTTEVSDTMVFVTPLQAPEYLIGETTGSSTFGAVPAGGMLVVMPSVDGVNTWQPPASGIVKDGFMRADGLTITQAHKNQGCILAVGSVLPDMVHKYPKGATTSGTSGGSNSGALTSGQIPLISTTAEGSHGHSWGGWWSNDNASWVTVDNGDGSQNTYSDGIAGINAWGAGGYGERQTGTVSSDHTHAFSTGGASSDHVHGVNLAHNHGNVGVQGPGGHSIGTSFGGGSASSTFAFTPDFVNENRAYGGAWFVNPALGDAWVNTNGRSSDHSHGGTTGGINQNHSHSYYLPSHRHWVKSRATTGNPTNHTHTVGSATPTEVSREPAYVEVIWVIRVV